jgi:hypothetical protein
VTSDPSSPVSFDSGARASGDFQFMLPANVSAGTIIGYHCDFHADATATDCSGMCATLTVE